MQYLASFEFCNHLDVREKRAMSFTLTVFGMSCDYKCSVSVYILNGVAITLKSYTHHRETTGLSNDSLQLRPFSKLKLLL